MSGKSKQTTTNQTAVDRYNAASSQLGNKQYTPVSADQIQRFQNPNTKAVIDTTLARAGQDQQMQINQIGDNAARSGAFGGSRHGVAEGIARGQFDMNNQATIAGLNGASYAQALQAALGENEQINKLPLAIQGLLGNLAQGTSSTTITKPPTDWGAILQAAGSAASAAAMSDRRLKRDVVPLGKRGGRNWYQFKYLWDDTVREGVMAQENLDIAFDVGGFLAVDYSGIL